MDFGAHIRELRLKKGMTQQQLAEKLGITGAAVGTWENNRARPRLDKLNELADLLDVPSAELLGIQYGSIKGTSAFVPLLGWTHMGELEDIDESDMVCEVPLEVFQAHPKAFCVHAQGECMNRRYPPDCIVLVDPTMEPTNGCAVLAQMGNQSIVRVYNRGASVLLLSPDSDDESFEDIVITAEDEGVMLVGVVCWYQMDHDLRW